MGVVTLVLCPYASSWPHTSARVTGLQPFPLVLVHSRHARHWSHHGTNGVDCTMPRGPPIASTAQSDRVLQCTSVSCTFPPLGQLPRAVCTGLFSSFCDPTSLLICPLANHLQRLGSSRFTILTQHWFPLTRQLTCASIASSILRRTAFLTDLPVDW